MNLRKRKCVNYTQNNTHSLHTSQLQRPRIKHSLHKSIQQLKVNEDDPTATFYKLLESIKKNLYPHLIGNSNSDSRQQICSKQVSQKENSLESQYYYQPQNLNEQNRCEEIAVTEGQMIVEEICQTNNLNSRHQQQNGDNQVNIKPYQETEIKPRDGADQEHSYMTKRCSDTILDHQQYLTSNRTRYFSTCLSSEPYPEPNRSNSINFKTQVVNAKGPNVQKKKLFTRSTYHIGIAYSIFFDKAFKCLDTQRQKDFTLFDPTYFARRLRQDRSE